MESIEKLVEFIFKDEKGISGRAAGTQPQDVVSEIQALMARWKPQLQPPVDVPGRGKLPLDERDAVLITYGDSLKKEGQAPLSVLEDFLRQRAADVLSGVHILPFSPYSSDDGFSVIDYRKVNPDLGDWPDIEELGKSFRLMFDLVLNHCSSVSPWFEAFTRDEEPYKDYFVTVPGDTDVSAVFRPRALPLLHDFETAHGPEWVWTTFSRDQVDLDFSNPRVLIEFLDILLMYVSRGAHIVRLDAIAYLWKELGTSCLHHPKTHAVVKLFRTVLEEAAPWVVILTETNVPHKENMSYFGSGDDEAHMIYQFSLPPLTLDAFIRGDATHLTQWAAELPVPEGPATYFNFLASHDGVGVLPARGYLSEEEIQKLIAAVQERGGRVSYKATPQGDVPYELNINYRDAVAEEGLSQEDRARKFLASQGIMLSLAGVPGIYVHSFLGSGNWQEGVAQTGHNRSINREKLDADVLERELAGEDTLRGKIFYGYKRMLSARRSEAARGAFHPQASQRVLEADPGLFTVIRDNRVLCLHNVTGTKKQVTLDLAELKLAPGPSISSFRDLITGTSRGKLLAQGRSERYAADFDLDIDSVEKGRLTLRLEPWEILWLVPEE